MTGYIIRRLLHGIIVVIGVMLVVFVLFHLESANAMARAIVGPRASAAEVQQVIQANGFDQPIWVQLWRELDNYAHLNFGHSYQFNAQVSTLIAQNLPKTLLLVGSATLVALIIAIPLGVFQTVRRNKPDDYVISSFAFILYATPVFVLGPLLVLFLAIDVRVFNATVPQGASVGSLITDWRSMTLPVLTLAAATLAAFSRYMRSSMMQALTEDYIRTARAKGAGSARVLFRHALPNALIPILTLVGLSIPAIIGGAVLTETVFNYPGIGLLVTDAAEHSDVATVVGTSVVLTIAAVIGSLVADILYAVVDPRIRYAKS